MNRLYAHASVGFCVASAALITSAAAFPSEEIPKTEPEYIAKVKTAAPASVVNNATITMSQPDGSPKTVQTGSNGFTCFIGNDGTPECDDENAMEWRKALQAKQAPPNKIGLIFMLAGDTGTSLRGRCASPLRVDDFHLDPIGTDRLLPCNRLIRASALFQL
jgi:hypothetical protein